MPIPIRRKKNLLPTDKIVMQLDDLPCVAKDEVLRMAREGYRQKLPTEGVPYAIKTIYGVGYKFEVDDA